MHWNRLKQLVCLPHFFLEFGWMATPIRKMSFGSPVYRPTSGFPFFVYGLRIAYFWSYWFILWIINLISLSYIYIYIYIFGEDEDRKMINFALIKPTKVWLWISYLSKTWNAHLVNPKNFSILREGNYPILILPTLKSYWN